MKWLFPLIASFAIIVPAYGAETPKVKAFIETQLRKASALRKPVCRAPLNAPQQGNVVKVVTLRKGITTRQQVINEFYEPIPGVGVKIPKDRVRYELAARLVSENDSAGWQIQLLDCVPNMRWGMSDGYLGVEILFDAKGLVQHVKGYRAV